MYAYGNGGRKSAPNGPPGGFPGGAPPPGMAPWGFGPYPGFPAGPPPGMHGGKGGKGERSPKNNGGFLSRGDGAKRPVGGLEGYDAIMSAPPMHLGDQVPQPTRQSRPGRMARIPVSVMMPNKKGINMFLDADDTLEDVYTAFERAGYVYKASDYTLSLGGQDLEDGPTPIKAAGIVDGSQLSATLKHRSGWGIVSNMPPTSAPIPPPAPEHAAPQQRPFFKEETEEWMQLRPGQSRTMMGYDESMQSATSRRGKILMNIYDQSMARPAPGTAQDMRKETACRNWAQDGHCKFGNRCHYSHAGRPKMGGLFFQRPDPRRYVACSFHAKGVCLRGEACPFKHDGPSPGTRATFGGGRPAPQRQ